MPETNNARTQQYGKSTDTMAAPAGTMNMFILCDNADDIGNTTDGSPYWSSGRFMNKYSEQSIIAARSSGSSPYSANLTRRSAGNEFEPAEGAFL